MPILLKKSLTFLLGGQMGTGPFFKDIGEVYKITGGYMETWEILKSLKTE